jgi:hypothetical protein
VTVEGVVIITTDGFFFKQIVNRIEPVGGPLSWECSSALLFQSFFLLVRLGRVAPGAFILCVLHFLLSSTVFFIFFLSPLRSPAALGDVAPPFPPQTLNPFPPAADHVRLKKSSGAF